jgi:hypothetical protein
LVRLAKTLAWGCQIRRPPDMLLNLSQIGQIALPVSDVD